MDKTGFVLKNDAAKKTGTRKITYVVDRDFGHSKLSVKHFKNLFSNDKLDFCYCQNQKRVMEYFSFFVFLTLLRHCVLGYLIVMEGKCSTGQEPCSTVNEPCLSGREIQPDMQKRIDSLEAKVAHLQETTERHINRSVVIGSCPDGFVRNNDSCYFIEFNKKLSFTEAVRFCEHHSNSHLIHVESQAEDKFIAAILTRKGLNWHYWNGLTDIFEEGKWKWYGTEENPNYINWAPGEPGGGVHENCAAFGFHTNFSWHDYPCTSVALHSVCETR